MKCILKLITICACFNIQAAPKNIKNDRKSLATQHIQKINIQSKEKEARLTIITQEESAKSNAVSTFLKQITTQKKREAHLKREAEAILRKEVHAQNEAAAKLRKELYAQNEAAAKLRKELFQDQTKAMEKITKDQITESKNLRRYISESLKNLLLEETNPTALSVFDVAHIERNKQNGYLIRRIAESWVIKKNSNPNQTLTVSPYDFEEDLDKSEKGKSIFEGKDIQNTSPAEVNQIIQHHLAIKNAQVFIIKLNQFIDNFEINPHMVMGTFLMKPSEYEEAERSGLFKKGEKKHLSIKIECVIKNKYAFLVSEEPNTIFCHKVTLEEDGNLYIGYVGPVFKVEKANSDNLEEILEAHADKEMISLIEKENLYFNLTLYIVNKKILDKQAYLSSYTSPLTQETLSLKRAEQTLKTNLVMAEKIKKQYKELPDQIALPLTQFANQDYFHLLFNIIPGNYELSAEEKTYAKSIKKWRYKTRFKNSIYLAYAYSISNKLNQTLNFITQRPFPFISWNKYLELGSSIYQKTFLKPLSEPVETLAEELILILL
jgi:hypothetical protein